MLSTLFTCSVVPETDEEKTRGNGTPREVPQWSKGNFQYNWIGIYVIIVPPIITLIGLALRVPITCQSAFWVVCFSILNGMVGITAGYHRLFSHRTYKAGAVMQWTCAFFGAGALQGSIKWWARNHRVHHRYTDTPKDPYDATRGFFFTHFGWFVMRMDYRLLGSADVEDLNQNHVVYFQRKYFGVMGLLSGLLLPWLLCGGTTGEWAAGFFYAAFGKAFLVHQFTFFINSLAHTSLFGGTQPYSDTMTPHDSLTFALITFGEGYHNFHHQFPHDYRNGYRWYHVDPTKWFITVCALLGFCSDCRRTPLAVIQRSLAEKSCRDHLKLVDLDTVELQRLAIEVTAVYTRAMVDNFVRKGRQLIILDGYVLDLEKTIPLEQTWTHAASGIHWLDAHPGGRAVLTAFIGKDATAAFNGRTYQHTASARNYLPHLRIAHFEQPPTDRSR